MSICFCLPSQIPDSLRAVIIKIFLCSTLYVALGWAHEIHLVDSYPINRDANKNHNKNEYLE